MLNARRPYVIAPLFAILVAAGIFTSELVPSAAAAGDPDNSLKSFTEVYSAVEQNFADKVDPNEVIYKGAIPGMLRMLDPHSSFFDPEAYREMREDQRGRYYGVGMQVVGRGEETMVVQPFDGSPAKKAGLRPGDLIQKVNDTSTLGLNVTEVADLLRGPRGTEVQVQVQRPGVEDPLHFSIVRGEIPRFSVKGGYYLEPGIGYIKIESFNENTNEEMVAKFREMDEAKIKGLVLDLRGNPGGLLNQGVAVASHFLKKGDLVVYHNGRNSPNRNYAATADGTGKDYPIVILVDRNTASAAEIVSGALQDHDRAWILGENTFGKGLVQTVYPMGDTTALALTTYQYFTPSGRLIQRDYSNISFLDYYTHSDLNEHNEEDVKMTDSGRTVYGGGGITPDQHWDLRLANPFQAALIRSDSFFDFTAQYLGPKPDTFKDGWQPDQAVVDAFHKYLVDKGIPFEEAAFTTNLDWTKMRLKQQIYASVISDIEAERVAIEADPEVKAAIDAMPKAQSLLDSAKDLLVQRMQSQTSAAAQ